MTRSIMTLAAPALGDTADIDDRLFVALVLVIGVTLLALAFVRKPRPPRRYTSADYQRMAVAACPLPTHRYKSGQRVSRNVMRYFCRCGAYQDHRISGGAR